MCNVCKPWEFSQWEHRSLVLSSPWFGLGLALHRTSALLTSIAPQFPPRIQQSRAGQCRGGGAGRRASIIHPADNQKSWKHTFMRRAVPEGVWPCAVRVQEDTRRWNDPVGGTKHPMEEKEAAAWGREGPGRHVEIRVTTVELAQ
ncbi:hypothetical protein KM043_003597 [Ampulex compressa]|nr:hypothetical protein KM043_003597 [Ampulex compressa]